VVGFILNEILLALWFSLLWDDFDFVDFWEITEFLIFFFDAESEILDWICKSLEH